MWLQDVALILYAYSAQAIGTGNLIGSVTKTCADVLHSYMYMYFYLFFFKVRIPYYFSFCFFFPLLFFFPPFKHIYMFSMTSFLFFLLNNPSFTTFLKFILRFLLSVANKICFLFEEPHWRIYLTFCSLVKSMLDMH